MPSLLAIFLAAGLSAGTYGVNKAAHSVHKHVLKPIARAVAHPMKTAKAIGKHQTKK